jgi:DNA helicase-2/ATP-dependent DNA helicase PcrA
MNETILEQLNESQRKAVIYNEGASLVIAGAGSGKTRVLTYKIAYLLEHGYDAGSILALTFTNKAATEMKVRISKLVGNERAHWLWMGTFHKMFMRILRTNATLLGYNAQLTIYDTPDSKSLLHSIIKGMGLTDKEYPAGRIQSRISKLKNHLVLPSDYESDVESLRYDARSGIPEFHRIYQAYQERCKAANAVDFDDILVNTFLLFRDHKDVCGYYADKFKYILVDEYQDTNYVQRQIILQLGIPSQHVCVVGDDAQSIYSFRGANIENILSFQNDFRDVQVFKLEQNYRSTKNIVLAANSLIAKNERQIPKSIFSEKEEGEKLLVTKAYSDVEEAVIVVNTVMKLRSSENSEYGDFAVLYRTNAQSRIFEEEMRKYSIPYRIYGGQSFYQRKEVKDVIAYFRMAVNPNDEEALKRVINFPARGIGDTTVNKIIIAASQHQTSLWSVLADPSAYDVSLNKSKLTTLKGFYDMMQGFVDSAARNDADVAGRDIIMQSGLMSVSTGDQNEDNERKENMGEVLTGMTDFVNARHEDGDEHVSLIDYLSEISLLTDQDTVGAKEQDTNKVTLMTIHAAKGLEFPTVFVVGLEENLFPNSMSSDNPAELEEERRLFYVAITRAEKHCFLSYAESRYHFGQMEYARPSRFLTDIDEQFLRFGVSSFRKQSAPSRFRPSFDDQFGSEKGTSSTPSFGSEKYKPAGESHSPFPSRPEHPVRPTVSSVRSTPPSGMKPVQSISTPSTTSDPHLKERLSLEVGQLIEHERFGVGKVVKVEGIDENRKATISFENLGTKVLLLRFARFKVIG